MNPEENKKKQLNYYSLLLLILGIILLNIGAFCKPLLLYHISSAIWTTVINILGWPWWYGPILIMTGWFLWGWYGIYRGFKKNTLDEYDMILAARYMRMSFFVGICMWGYLFLYLSGRLTEIHKSMVMLFRFGVWSISSLSLFFTILFVFGITVFFVVQWVIMRFFED